jgi:hypothetical protein
VKFTNYISPIFRNINRKTVKRRVYLKNPDIGGKSIVIKIFDELYSIIVMKNNCIGDLRRTMGVWLDINPVD